MGLALSGGGHRAAVWAAGAVLGLVDAGAAPKVVSISSVSGGSIANGVIVASGDLQGASRADFESWLRPGLRQWAHEGLFFSGPSTDKWVAGTLGMVIAAVAGLMAALVATISASRGWATSTVVWTSFGLFVAMVLMVGAAAMRMPSGVIGFGMLLGSLFVFPFAFLAISAATASAWWLILVWALAIVLFVIALKRFGGRSAAVVGALGKTLFAGPATMGGLATRPVHHVFCATNLRTGNNLYLTNRMTWGFPGIAAPAGDLTLATAVQASACLPGAFLARTIDATPGKTGGTATLDDGGVYDNMADQWEWGFANRRHNASGIDATDLLTAAQPKAADRYIVVNASKGMEGTNDLTIRPGLMGEVASALAAKDVLYDVSTATRRRLLVDVFARARRDPNAGPSGMLVHIGTNPYDFAESWSHGHDDISDRARQVLALLDELNEPWAQITDANSKVATTLGPLEQRTPGTTARLLHHAWVLTRVSAYVLEGWGEVDPAHVDDWRRARFDALVAQSAPQGAGQS